MMNLRIYISNNYPNVKPFDGVNSIEKNYDYNIAKKDILKMFDIFEKQENIENELNPGLGIGLPLVKSLTKLLGGDIKVETNNKGISFIVSLPIK